MKDDSTIIYDKLVRDKIPDIITKASKDPKIEILYDDDEFHEALAQKIIEEGNEYLETKELQELADILEILEALLKIHKISMGDIKKIQNEKKEKRGVFNQRIKLLSVSSKPKT